ncbi:cro regulatory protein [Streptococcus uberis S6261]|nr:cro regulatory protein [Streptococcus uberis S6261]
MKELRKAKKLTQENLANEIGVTKLTISRWENGEVKIKPEKADLLSNYFGVHPSYLMGYIDVPGQLKENEVAIDKHLLEKYKKAHDVLVGLRLILNER